MSAGAIKKRFRNLGWDIESRSKHEYAVKPGANPVRMPNAHGSDISVDLIRTIIRQAGISRSKWLG